MISIIKVVLVTTQRLLETGSDAKTPCELAKSIWAVNAICLFGFVASIPYIIVFLAIKNWPVAIVTFLVMMAYILCLVFNSKRHYSAAKSLLIIELNIVVFVFSLLLGIESGMPLTFFFLVALPFIFYVHLNRVRSFIGCATPLVSLLIIYHWKARPLLDLSEEWLNRLQNINIFCTVFLLGSSIYYLRKINDDVSRGLQETLRKLQRETNLLQQILDSISDFVILEGPGSELLWGNKAFRDFHGMPNQDLKSLVDAPLAVPASSDSRLSLIPAVEETVLTRYDGTKRWFNAVKSPIMRSGQKLHMQVAVCRDITEQKQTENLLLRQQNQMLAAARLSALGEMAAGIAHEINNPLAIISGRSLNIRRLLQNGTDQKEKILDFIGDIDSTSRRIAKIIRGLRTFAREGEEDPFVIAPLEEVIDEVLALCSARFLNHGIELIYDRKSSQDVQIECRPVQISQVLLNLLANAFDAVEGRREKWVRLEFHDDGSGIELTVADSGKGIPDSVRAKMFQPFFTTKEVGKGTGLGLSISRGIIQVHNGTLEIDHAFEPTCFRIRLPKRQPEIPIER